MATDLGNDTEFRTTDYGFAAYLAAKNFMFIDAIPTGARSSRGKYPQMAFSFIVSKDEDMQKHADDYRKGTDASRIPAIVMFNKMRLMRQAVQQPYNAGRGK